MGKILKHNDLIFASVWGRNHVFSVGTAEGFYADCSWTTVEKGVASSIARGDELAFTCKESAVLCSDPGFYERRAKRREGAIEVVADETVEIEGRKYRVRLVGRDYSDGIKFTPDAG